MNRNPPSTATTPPPNAVLHLLGVDGGIELVGEPIDAVGERDLEPVRVANLTGGYKLHEAEGNQR